MKKLLVISLTTVGLSLMGILSNAQAGVTVSVNLGSSGYSHYRHHAPVYYSPQPRYYCPPPVVIYEQPRYHYYRPEPVIIYQSHPRSFHRRSRLPVYQTHPSQVYGHCR